MLQGNPLARNRNVRQTDELMRMTEITSHTVSKFPDPLGIVNSTAFKDADYIHSHSSSMSLMKNFSISTSSISEIL